MCSVALVAIVLAAATTWLASWLPNIAVGAISLAVTAAVVEELITRAERGRVRDRLTYAENRLDHALLLLTNAVQMDYIRWRAGSDTVIGGEPVEILTRWLEGDSGLPVRPPLDPGQRPHILFDALTFADEVERVAGEVREHFDARLAVQMSHLEAERRKAETIGIDAPTYATLISSSNPIALDLFRTTLILQAARDFAQVYREVRDPWPWFLVLDAGVLPAAESRP